MEKGLPTNTDAERLVLGSIMLDSSWFPLVAGMLQQEDFSVEKHRRIFSRMDDINERGEKIDRVTVANELMNHGELESVDGLSYLVSLDDGMPQIPNLEAYVKIIKEKAILRRYIYSVQGLMNRAMLAEETSEELISAMISTASKLYGGVTVEDCKTVTEIVKEYPGGIDAFLNPRKDGNGVKTPWRILTESISGLNEGELVVVAGRPSMGKSIVAMDIAFNAAKDSNVGVVFFSLEMSKESLVRRTLSAETGVDAQKFRAGYMDKGERQKIARSMSGIMDIPLLINDRSSHTVASIHASLFRASTQFKPRIIVVDHMQLIRSTSRSFNKHDQISEISHDLKALAKEFSATVVLVSQLNRDCERENRRPALSDLRESGTIEEDADVVLFVHRPERYMKNHGKRELLGVAEFLIAKQRNGPTGKLDMVFLASRQKFEVQAGYQEMQPIETEGEEV